MGGENNNKTINPDSDSENYLTHESLISSPSDQSPPTQSSDTSSQNAENVFSRLYPSQPISPPLDQSVPSTQSPYTPPQSADDVFSILYDDKRESTITAKNNHQIPLHSDIQLPSKYPTFFVKPGEKLALFGIIAIIIGIFISGILVGYFGLSQKSDPITGSWTYNGQINDKNISMTLIFNPDGDFNGYTQGLLSLSGHWIKKDKTHYTISHNVGVSDIVFSEDQIFDSVSPERKFLKQ